MSQLVKTEIIMWFVNIKILIKQLQWKEQSQKKDITLMIKSKEVIHLALQVIIILNLDKANIQK
jgi:hypothetical protein